MTTEQVLMLRQYALTVGGLPQANSIEQLELSGATTVDIAWQGKTVRSAFITPYSEKDQFHERLCDLLRRLVLKLKTQHATDLLNGDHVVYLILPELSTGDDVALNELVQLIMRRLPGLLQSARSRLFAHGSAGTLMALSAAKTALQQNTFAQVWLLSADSMCNSKAFEQYVQAGAAHVLSEGAVALNIGRALAGSNEANKGIRLLFTELDAKANSRNEQEDATANLLRQAAAEVVKHGQTLRLAYMPDCGDETASLVWLTQYKWLHGAVTADTEMRLPSYHCGELGASGGLYRLLHVMRSAQKGRLSGLTMQFEQSLQRYRSVALFASAINKH